MTASSSPIFVGLDCGGSSCRALAIDEQGEVLFQGQSGAANLVSTPEGRLRRNLRHAVQGCPTPTYVCGCFAGLIDEHARTRAITFLSELFPLAQLRAEPDYSAALSASDDTDLCVISGTGSLVCSWEDGKVVKSGGRGYILGDEGSGFSFGRDAVKWYLRNRETASPALQRAILDQFNSDIESDIVTAVHRAPSPAAVLAKLVRPIALDAQAGIPYAVASLERGMSELAEVVATHLSRFPREKEELVVTLSGGVWKAATIYRQTFDAALRAKMPDRNFALRRISEPPVIGAVKLARLGTGGTP